MDDEEALTIRCDVVHRVREPHHAGIPTVGAGEVICSPGLKSSKGNSTFSLRQQGTQHFSSILPFSGALV